MNSRRSSSSRCSRIVRSIAFAIGTSLAAQNAIVLENQLPGTDPNTWYVAPPGDVNIQGFATDFSVDVGNTVHFKIDTDASAYHIDVYRLGWYQGLGARLVGNGVVTATLPQIQPAPIFDAATAMTDCGNWAESAHWDVPANAVSGIHVAKLTRDDATAGTSLVIFVVRDDASTSDVVFQTDDETWNAYNLYGGASLYPAGGAAPGYNHATKVSYNRPFDVRNSAGGSGYDLFSSQYPMVRWLERNGYDVCYMGSVDVDRHGALLPQHQLFLSVGHDEYWSGPQRANVTAARDAGVNLAFFSGNEVYWKTRFEPSIDGSNTPYRTLVCYKEGSLGENGCGTKCDPSPEWTGLWRDGCAPYDPNTNGACRPENALSGQIGWNGTIGAIQVPDTFKDLRFWRNTGIAALLPGQTAALCAESLGIEWDVRQFDASYPSRRIVLSHTLLGGQVHELSLYRADSGALVFGAGTVQWSWGLDDFHTYNAVATNVDMQQATVNLFADMGIAPGSLQSGLVPGGASSDTQAPASMITQPADNATVASNGSLLVQGVAVDTGGGVVAGVEVSTDGGATWSAANGTTVWSWPWSPPAQGAYTIISRAFDDTLNIEPTGSSGSPNFIHVTVTAPSCPCTVFGGGDGPTAGVPFNDGQSIELGMRFRTDVAGSITALRYYKEPGTTGVHVGNLWTAGGINLGSATFTGETASGWQEVTLTTPIAVAANTTYVVSYFSPSGHYAATGNYFTQQVGNGLVHGLADGFDGPNGVYHYGGSAFPTDTFNHGNYWADVVFADGPGDTTPPTITARSPSPGAVTVPTSTVIQVTFDEDIDALSLSPTAFELRDSLGSMLAATIGYDALAHRATLAPAAPLDHGATYTVTVRGGATAPHVTDLAGNALAADDSWSFTTAAVTAGPFGVFSPVDPGLPVANDGQPLELGMKFRTLVDGVITAIRYYKPAGAAGTRTGNLWTSAGVNLASAPFAGETASGWQEVQLAAPVPVVAGTTYVVSYFTTSGDYVGTQNVFTQELGNGLVRGLADGTDGPNGVYLYTPTTAFPNQPATKSNYYVDVVFFAAVEDVTPPSVTLQSPAPNDVGVPTSVHVEVTFDEVLDPSSVTTATFELRDPSSTLVAATVAYDSGTGIARLTPATALANSAIYTVTLHGGASGARVRDAAGNALGADEIWTFTTAALPACPCSLLGETAPAGTVSNDAQSLELGLRFRVPVAGAVSALRYYKPIGATGVHTGSLWTNGGTLLARQVFTNETASGWQQVLLPTPVQLLPDTTYVVSYFSASGDYISTLDYFTAAAGSGLVQGLADGFDGANGVFTYGPLPTFPTGTFRSSNYWADVVFYREHEPRNEPYGAGCPGAGGLVPVLTVLGVPASPVQPNPTFGLRLGNALPVAVAILAVGTSAPSDAACSLLIDNIIQDWFVLTTATGVATVPVPIPVSPSFLDMIFYVQGGVIDPMATGSFLPGLALSAGVRLTVGNP